MAETASPRTLTFHGERTSWVFPTSLEELVRLKTSNPEAPLVMGNTNIGEHRKATFCFSFYQRELGQSSLETQQCLFTHVIQLYR